MVSKLATSCLSNVYDPTKVLMIDNLSNGNDDNDDI